MEIELTPVMGYLQRDCNYTCPVTGEIVTSQRKRNYIMESHDLRDANDYRSNFQKQKQEFEQRKQLAATLSLPERDEKSIGKMLEELNPIPN